MMQEFYDASLQMISTAGKYLVKATKDIAGPAISAVASQASEKIKYFYQNNKEVVISVSVAATVYLLMRKKEQKRQENKSTIKSREGAKKSMIKSFISEHSQIEEEDPTMISKREWSIEQRAIKTDYFFSSDNEADEEEARDKIFFEVYKGYLQTE